MKRALVVGGANGIGLSLAVTLAGRGEVEQVYIVDKAPVPERYLTRNMMAYQFDLTSHDYTFFDRFDDIDTLMITAGFGRLALFEDIDEAMIPLYFQINTIPVLRLVKHFYPRLMGAEPFYCGVMVSIAGFMSSPFFSIYGASKAALKIFIESVNVELEKGGSMNRILNVSPGSIKGTAFNQGETDLSQLEELTVSILSELDRRSDLYIPHYDDVYKQVLQRYHDDFRAEGIHSYEYKQNSGRPKH